LAASAILPAVWDGRAKPNLEGTAAWGGTACKARCKSERRKEGGSWSRRPQNRSAGRAGGASCKLASGRDRSRAPRLRHSSLPPCFEPGSPRWRISLRGT
jgi:hypothetical protein